MTLSKKRTRDHLVVVGLAVGISFPLYAMADTPPDADSATKVVTKTITTKTVIHHKHHRAASASAEANKADAVNNAKALDAEAANNAGASGKADTNQGKEKRTVWKNGVVFHDVEPTGQAVSSFGVPASTDDTLKGGVTTTTTPAPAASP